MGSTRMKKQKWTCLWGVVFPLLAHGQTTVAIGDFENRTERFFLDAWTKKMPEVLAAEWSATPDLVVVDRSRLGAVLDERKLQAAGLTDSSRAVEVGRLLSAEYIVTGAMQTEGNGVRIDARVTSVATGRMVAESATARSAEPIEKMAVLLANNLRVRMTGKGTYVESVTLRRLPTRFFLGGTLLAGLSAVWIHQTYVGKLEAYHDAVALEAFDPAYRSANRWYHARTAAIAVTGAALAGTLFCWIRDLDPDRIRAGAHPVLGFGEGDVRFGIRIAF
jgi:TolB-like protein